jgi:protein kinase C substrate 80K-H
MAVKGAITSYDEFNDSYKPVDVWTDPRLHPTTTTDSSSQATASGEESEASKIRQGSYFSNFIKEQINSVQKFIDRVFSSQFPIDASSARSDYWSSDTERNDAKRELDDLNTKLNRDMGPDGEYSALSDKCFELDNGEYVYSVCMFGEANQKSNKNHDSVSLGYI